MVLDSVFPYSCGFHYDQLKGHNIQVCYLLISLVGFGPSLVPVSLALPPVL